LPAQLQLAELDFQRKRLDEANSVVNRILQEHPGNTQALVTRARVWLEQKQPDKSIKDLEAVQHEDPDIAISYYLMGAAYAQMGDLDHAQQNFEKSIGLNPHLEEAYAALAEMMLDRGQSDAAVKYAQELQTTNPKRTDTHLFLGSAYANLRDLPKAEAEFQQYCALQPDSPLGQIRLGYLYLMEKKLELAQKQFEAALAISPRNMEALGGLALAMRLHGQGDQAIARIKSTLAHSETAELETLLGKTYTDLGQYALAESSLQRALELNPQDFSIYVALGTLYARQNSVEQAVTQFESALRLNPRSVGLWTTLGMLRQIQHQDDLAIKAYEKAVELEPNAGFAANNLAWLYSEHGGDLDKALDLARRAKLALPNNPSVSDTLGWLYYKHDLYSSALPLFQEAVRQEPAHAMFHFHLAATLLHEGTKDQARTEMKKALSLDKNLATRSDVQEVLKLDTVLAAH
jgi:tetratricopeptide (TPR) repeat protein